MTLHNDIAKLRKRLPPLLLPEYEGWSSSVHCFSEVEQGALRTALGADRPLLIRGEPGTGKTQVARAAAVVLERHFVSKTFNARTEIEDLYWSKDVVRRLADAQVISVKLGGMTSIPEKMEAKLDEDLDERRYVEPGALWWGFDWENAEGIRKSGIRKNDVRERAPWVKESGAVSSVILLDEIDKADPVLPQGLLEALGAGRFEGPVGGTPIRPSSKVARPLIIITSNGERELPYAFRRRCVVLKLSLPEGEKLKPWLVKLGAEHVKTWSDSAGTQEGEQEVLEACAQCVVEGRKAGRGRERPGPAEYLDLLRAVFAGSSDKSQRLKDVGELSTYVVNKYRDPMGRDTDCVVNKYHDPMGRDTDA